MTHSYIHTHTNTYIHIHTHTHMPQVVELLLTMGADVAVGTKYGKMPLHAAAGQGFADICQALLEGECMCVFVCMCVCMCVYGKVLLHAAVWTGVYRHVWPY